ncbi:MAG: amino acid carrier protein [Oscillospiraceae bacterium]|nr:amino acid carrier protein [Oscillospiraceae bacterium]
MSIINRINENILWGMPMLVLFIGTGVYFSVKLKFFQLNTIKIFKDTLFCKDNAIVECDNASDNKQCLSPFQTLTNSLALTIGTGNIVALGTAIAIGGAGAVFWMWASAIIGMATTYAENFLGIKYRKKRPDGGYIGGAFWYIEKALGRLPAKAFAICCVCASLGIGNMTQINAMSYSMKYSFNTPLWITGIIAVVPVGLLVFGGAKILGKVTEKAIPVVSLVYIVGCLAVIFVFIKDVPTIFIRIITEAFGVSAIGGGAAGVGISKAMSWGFRRGVFSNEAGLGSTVTMNSMSSSDNAHKQGLWATLTVFFDTIVICTLTAFPILLTGADKLDLRDGGMNLASAAFSGAFGNYAGMFVTISVAMFAIGTVSGWSVFGAVCVEYLFGQKLIKPFLTVFVGFAFIGAVMRLDLVWGLADLMNGIMAIPNLLSVILLSDKIVANEPKANIVARSCKELHRKAPY